MTASLTRPPAPGGAAGAPSPARPPAAAHQPHRVQRVRRVVPHVVRAAGCAAASRTPRRGRRRPLARPARRRCAAGRRWRRGSTRAATSSQVSGWSRGDQVDHRARARVTRSSRVRSISAGELGLGRVEQVGQQVHADRRRAGTEISAPRHQPDAARAAPPRPPRPSPRSCRGRSARRRRARRRRRSATTAAGRLRCRRTPWSGCGGRCARGPA